MTKIAVIGDIHGRKSWEILKNKKNEYDKIIFMGDYVDSFFRSDSEILKNLQEIIYFSEDNPEKVILIEGNHDNQYYLHDYSKVRASGYRPSMAIQLKNIFMIHKDSFRAAFQFENTLFIHGGLMTGFYNILLKRFEKEDDENYADYLNKIWKYKMNLLLDVSSYRGGNDLYSGPFWTDWVELTNQKKFLPINQIVGHSARFGGESKIINKGKNFLLNVDVLDFEECYFEIIFNKKIIFSKINIS